MTFDRWFSQHIAPTLPTDIPPEVLKVSREMMAACWNAAVYAVNEYVLYCENERISLEVSNIAGKFVVKNS